MIDIRDLHAGWTQDPDYRAEYGALEGESALAGAPIRARADAGLTQEQLAERVGTKQWVIARWEGGRMMPSTRTLARLVKATDATLQISFAPSWLAVKDCAVPKRTASYCTTNGTVQKKRDRSRGSSAH